MSKAQVGMLNALMSVTEAYQLEIGILSWPMGPPTPSGELGHPQLKKNKVYLRILGYFKQFILWNNDSSWFWGDGTDSWTPLSQKNPKKSQFSKNFINWWVIIIILFFKQGWTGKIFFTGRNRVGLGQKSTVWGRVGQGSNPAGRGGARLGRCRGGSYTVWNSWLKSYVTA